MIVWPWRAYPFFWCGGNRCFAYLNIIAWTCTDNRWQRKELPWKSFSFLDNFALKVGLSLNSWRFFNFYNNNRFCPTPKCRCLLRPVVSTRSSIADVFSNAVFRLWRAACSDLGLFLSSAVKKKKTKKRQKSIHVNFEFSMVKATISGILLKSIADMKRWSTYQLTDHSVSQYCTLK